MCSPAKYVIFMIVLLNACETTRSVTKPVIYISVTVDLSDESRQLCPPSNNSAGIRSRLFRIQDREVSSTSLTSIHVSHTVEETAECIN